MRKTEEKSEQVHESTVITVGTSPSNDINKDSTSSEIIKETKDSNESILIAPSQLIVNDMEVVDDALCNMLNFSSTDSYKLKQHKRDDHRELSASITPPHKKRKEPEQDIEKEVENVLKGIQELVVETKENECKTKEENKIPERLNNMLRLEGMNIKECGVIQVGGGGKCGAKCLSIHTTSTENVADEIRTNVNRHIIENWETYRDSSEFPYTAQVGGGTRRFQNQDKFLIFLMEEEKEASKLWMTHFCMQAASTMLNMNIKNLNHKKTNSN